MANEIAQDATGLYTLCVFDAESCPDEEILDDFGKFGAVKSLHRSKNLIFVRYGTLEEAVTCYESMQKQTKFRVRPGKRKENTDSSENRRRHAVDINSSNGEMSQRNDSGDFQGRRSEGGPNNNRRSGGDFRERGSDGDMSQRSDSGDFRGRRSEGLPNNNRRSGGDFRERGSDGDMSQRSDSGDFRGRSEGGPNNNRRSGGDFRERGSEMNGKSPMPKLIPASLAPPPVNKDKPPQLVAKTMVIGNLPPLVKQFHIYELCSSAKAKPLHIAMKQINRPGYATMHYAFVYVKDKKDEKSLLEGLNGLKFNGYNLIVNSAEKLAEQGSEFLKCRE